MVLSSATSSRKPSFSATSVSVKAVETWDDEPSESSELLEACESSRLRDPPPELPLLPLSLASSSEPFSAARFEPAPPGRTRRPLASVRLAVASMASWRHGLSSTTTLILVQREHWLMTWHVSVKSAAEGLAFTIMTVPPDPRLPERWELRRRASLDSRKRDWFILPDRRLARQVMRVNSEVLMLFASPCFLPVAVLPVRSPRSEPARSTSQSVAFPSSRAQTQCEREESLFRLVLGGGGGGHR